MYKYFIIIIIAILAILLGNITSKVIFKNTGHACIWSLCPYKGIHWGLYGKAVEAYTNEFGTDAYKIDMLHLEYPNLNNYQLDSLLETR